MFGIAASQTYRIAARPAASASGRPMIPPPVRYIGSVVPSAA
jgi:hypothetical protein